MTEPPEAASPRAAKPVLEIVWPLQLRGEAGERLRGAITLLLGQPGGLLVGVDAIQNVQEAAGFQPETNAANAWLRRPSVQYWIAHNRIGMPRVWLTRHAKTMIRSRKAEVVGVAVLQATGDKTPGPVSQQPEKRPRATGRVRINAGVMVITWPEALSDRRFAADRRALAYLLTLQNSVRGREAFAAFIEKGNLPTNYDEAMRWLAHLEEAGWITRNVFGQPRIRLTARAFKEIAVKIEKAAAAQPIAAADLPLPAEFDPSWGGRAACRSDTTGDFYEEAGPRAERAKRVCRTCTERLHCLVEALEQPEYGIRGGMNSQRRSFIREHRKSNYPWRKHYSEVREWCIIEDRPAS